MEQRQDIRGVEDLAGAPTGLLVANHESVRQRVCDRLHDLSTE